ncbi:MAG: ATP-binding cassette domain-containing protein [Spirochaetota bacterium]
MVFSYRVDDDYILRDINLPLERGTLTIITGVENLPFQLLGGIVSGLFPVEAGESIPHLEELIKYFTGSLELEEGKIPVHAVYVGPDPERHLLFSRVDEELRAQVGGSKDHTGVLSSFGLGKHLIERRIATLSGGEKMKLALAIAFSKEADCIVLHGVVPWLDGNGMEHLVEKITEAKEMKISVVVLEQEVSHLFGDADQVLYFDGKTLFPFSEGEVVMMRKNRFLKLEKLKASLNNGGNPDHVVEFEDVSFAYPEDPENPFRLRGISFSLSNSKVYGLTGDNGTGKSTIAKLMLRLLKPQGGVIRFLGREISNFERREIVKKICFIGQFPEQQITLSEVDQYRRRAEKDKNAISYKLLDLCFPPGSSYPVSELLPLEMKLLVLSSSVSEDTRLIIFDEPTWGIDIMGEERLIELLGVVAEELKDIAVFIISHDLDFIRNLGAEVLTLKDGVIKD